jgi:hypothetical protein
MSKVERCITTRSVFPIFTVPNGAWKDFVRNYARRMGLARFQICRMSAHNEVGGKCFSQITITPGFQTPRFTRCPGVFDGSLAALDVSPYFGRIQGQTAEVEARYRHLPTERET